MLDFNQLSYWEKETYINHTDFLVIGSGIVGLSAAIHYKQRNPNKKVTLIERGYLPTGASSKNAGFACIGSPSELLDDLKNNSEDAVFSTVERRWKGLCYLREMLGDNAIDYKSYGSYELFTAADNAVFEQCQAQLDYLNQKMEKITGITRVFSVNTSICTQFGFNSFQKAITHAAEGQIDTGKMIKNLVKVAQSLGIIILNTIEALAIKNNELTTNRGKISFKKAAICTNGFFKKLYPTDQVEPARAQIIITKPIDKLPFKGIFHFDEGYYYFRTINNRVLFGGGRNLAFKAENTTQIANTDLIVGELNQILSTKILPNTPFEVDYSWAGIMGVGPSKAPLVKQLDENIFCAVRLGGMGVAIGTLVGRELIENLID